MAGGTREWPSQSYSIKIMYYNISHQTLTPCAFMDDDARVCYDSIVTRLSSADCRKWGLGHNVSKFTNRFIEKNSSFMSDLCMEYWMIITRTAMISQLKGLAKELVGPDQAGPLLALPSAI